MELVSHGERSLRERVLDGLQRRCSDRLLRGRSRRRLHCRRLRLFLDRRYSFLRSRFAAAFVALVVAIDSSSLVKGWPETFAFA